VIESMSGTIAFWFDFGSPYAYLASFEVEAVAARHGRTVAWRPFLLGAAFKTTGMRPLTDIPLRGDYAARDLARAARRLGVPFRLPAAHPVAAVAAGRAFLWAADTDARVAETFARAVFQACFGEGRNVGDPAEVLSIAADLGLDAQALSDALASQALKDRFRAQNEEALANGIFGSPFFIVDGEPFWGADRLPMIDDWLARGGW